ncbi:MAG TPA: nucleotidyltransferase domain-containing protein [Phycisphaerales bacterium]|nr:nucleotidyltransferase domain-containing protein [Phycisphaerales bacterium]HMP36212.1 nucleotidyltransferase domain-containing protein [Phycisphaerales bacterium]
MALGAGRQFEPESRSEGRPCDDSAAQREPDHVVRDCIAARCGEHVRVLAVYRFGSTVGGVVHPGSDIDLAVLADRPLDPVGLYDAAQDLAVLFERDVDLIDLRRADGTMRAQVIGTGVRTLAEDASAADRFAAEALADYAWFNEIRGKAVEAFLTPYREVSARGR